MNQWEMVKLGEVCEILDSQRIPVSSELRNKGEYPYYGANGVQDYVDKYIFDDELVLIAEDGGHFGSKTKPISYRVSGKCWVNNHAHVLKPLNCLDVDFLCYSTMFYDVRKLIKGTTRLKLNQTALREMQIPLPPLETQQHMAKTLDLATEIIEGYRQKLTELEKLVQSVFYEMFGDPVENEKGWEVKRIENLCDKIGSGATPRGGQEAYISEGISLIRSMNVHDGRFLIEDLAHINDDQADLLKNVTVESNDVLLNITGASVTRSCVVPDEILPARVNQHVSILRCNKKINHVFLNRLLIYKSMKGKLYHLSVSAGSTREALTKLQLQMFEIPLPPLPLQEQFAQIVEKIEEEKKLVQEGLHEAEQLFGGLLQGYFEG